MIKLSNGGAYLVNGVESYRKIGRGFSRSTWKQQAACHLRKKQQKMAYDILKNHNTSGDMKKSLRLNLIVTRSPYYSQTRASGLEKFPIRYVLKSSQQPLCGWRYN